MTGCSATVCKFGAELCSTRCGLFLNLPKRLGDDLRIPGKGTDVLDNGILDLLSRERLAGAGVPPALLGGTTNIVPIPPPALRGVRVMHGDPAGVAMEQPAQEGAVLAPYLRQQLIDALEYAHEKHLPRRQVLQDLSSDFRVAKSFHQAHGLRGGRAVVLLILLLKPVAVSVCCVLVPVAVAFGNANSAR
jgi:hypothetical protein